MATSTCLGSDNLYTPPPSCLYKHGCRLCLPWPAFCTPHDCPLPPNLLGRSARAFLLWFSGSPPARNNKDVMDLLVRISPARAAAHTTLSCVSSSPIQARAALKTRRGILALAFRALAHRTYTACAVCRETRRAAGRSSRQIIDDGGLCCISSGSYLVSSRLLDQHLILLGMTGRQRSLPPPRIAISFAAARCAWFLLPLCAGHFCRALPRVCT